MEEIWRSFRIWNLAWKIPDGVGGGTARADSMDDIGLRTEVYLDQLRYSCRVITEQIDDITNQQTSNKFRVDQNEWHGTDLKVETTDMKRFPRRFVLP
jgi:hypothetical protein